MITLTHVRKTYGGPGQAVIALVDVSLRIDAGEFVAIAGASGSGKSTLLHIIGCLDAPTSGTYELDGVPVADLDDAELSRLRNEKIGFVFQSFNLIPRTTALENVETPMLYGGVPSRDRARDVMAMVGMTHRARHFPGELSGGEQQRVAIARALVMQPAVLIADEPTGNLDTATGAQIMALLREMHMGGLTVVLVTHDEAIARQADRVLTMTDGRLTGPVAQPSVAGVRS